MPLVVYALARLYWRFGRPRTFLVIVVYAADPLAPWRRCAAEMSERINAL